MQVKSKTEKCGLAGDAGAHRSTGSNDPAGAHCERKLHPCSIPAPSTAPAPAHGSCNEGCLTPRQVLLLNMTFTLKCMLPVIMLKRRPPHTQQGTVATHDITEQLVLKCKLRMIMRDMTKAGSQLGRFSFTNGMTQKLCSA